jgi:hypothetical protein
MDTHLAKGKVARLLSNQQHRRWKFGVGRVARGRHAPARDPSDEYDGAHPIRIGLGDGVEGSAKAPFIMGVSGELERSA